MRLFQTLDILFRYAVFLYIFSKISTQFFSYESTTLISQQIEEEEKLVPSVSFCFPIEDNLNETNITTISDSVVVEDLILDVHILDEFGTVTSNLTDEVKKSLVVYFKPSIHCFIIRFFEGLNKIRLAFDETLVLKLDDTERQFSYELLDPSVNNIPFKVSSTQLERNKSTKIYFYYSIRSYLPSPYASNCIDYRRETTYLSRDECKRKCHIARSVINCGVITPNVSIRRGTEEERLRKYKFAQGKSQLYCVKLSSLHQMCSARCRKKDCEQRFCYSYEDEVKGTLDANHTELRMNLDITPMFDFKESASYSIGNYIADASGLFGMFLGISFDKVIALLPERYEIDLRLAWPRYPEGDQDPLQSEPVTTASDPVRPFSPIQELVLEDF